MAHAMHIAYSITYSIALTLLLTYDSDLLAVSC